MRATLALVLPVLAAVGVAAGAQEPAPAPGVLRPDTTITERRDASGRVVEREVHIRAGGPGDVTILRGGPRVRARSVLGVRLGDADTTGLRVAEVVADGPAARAGLTADDRLVAVNGAPLRLAPGDADDPLLAGVPARRLERTVARLDPGSVVRLAVVRGRTQRTVAVTTAAPRDVAGMPDGDDGRPWRLDAAPFEGRGFPRLGRSPERRGELEARARAFGDSARARAERRPALGLRVQPTGSARDTLGLFVAGVTSGGPAERAGIVEGDRIAAINGVDVRVPRDEMDDGPAAGARASRFTRELQRARPGDDVALRVWRDGQWRDVRVRAGRAAEVFGDEGLFFRQLAPMAPLPPMPPMPPMPPVRSFERRPAPRPPVAPVPPVAPLAPRARLLRSGTAI